jgi:hypothetical protein
MLMIRAAAACLLVFMVLAPAAGAQWSSDPAVNLSIADAASDQVQVKLAPTPDGGCWVSWFDGIASGFDVRVQKLDALGNETLPHAGVLVANRSFSSTQDYGLDADASGNAVLAFRDDAGVGVQITAAKVTPAGVLAWGAGGVQLTATTQFVASPRVAATGTGVVVAWTQDLSARVHGLNASGASVWGDVVLAPGVGSFSPADLHDSGNDAILSYVYQTGGFGSPRRLRAQKFDSTGAKLWAAEGVLVFNTGSLQFGNFPSFVPDGTGGAVFSWYDTGSLQLQCYAQRLLADGSPAFALNGVALSTNAARIRVSPWAAFDSSTSETYLFWVEESSGQSMWGLYGQKLDSSGARQWTDSGSALIPIGSTVISQVRDISSGGGAMVYWEESVSFNNDVLRGAHVSSAGAFDVGPFDVSSTASGKTRLAVAEGALGNGVLAWSDNRVDANDVLGQSVEADGSLGPAGGFWTDLGSALAGVYGEPSLLASGSLVVGTPFRLSLSNALESSTAGLFVGLSQLNAPFKGGTLVPAVDLLVILPTNGSGGLDLSLPAWPPGLPSGLALNMQTWVLDAAGPVGYSASNAVARTVP